MNTCIHTGHHIAAALLGTLDLLMEEEPKRGEWTFVMMVIGAVLVMTTGGAMRHV